MPKPQPKADSRSLVDRWLDRLKNNRVAAVLILVCLAVGALASLTDSVRKLSGAFSSFSKPDVAGEWASDTADFYPIGPEVMTLRLREAAANRIIGSVQFGDPTNPPSFREFDILEGKLEGKTLSFSFDSGARLHQGAEKTSVPLRETVTGTVADNELILVYQREGNGGVSTVARRVQP